MDYQKNIGFTGDPDKALECARNVFVGLNFRVMPVGRSQLDVENSAVSLNKKQNALLGISKAFVTAIGSSLAIEAEFGAVRRAITLLTALIIGTDVPIFFLCATVMWATHQMQPFVLGLLLAVIVLPWIVIFPLMRTLMRRRVTKALDTLLENMASIAAGQH